MLHGCSARFHPGSVAYLTDLQDCNYADEACDVQRFHEKSQRWEVRLRHPRFRGKCITVRESCLNFAFAIVPEHAAHSLDSICLQGVQLLERPGNCGMGLATLTACSAGEVVMEEHPFLLSGADERSIWRTRSRWQAFLQMQAQARGDAMVRKALQAFEKLSIGSWSEDRTQDFQDEATAIFKHLCEDQPGLQEKPWIQDAIVQVLKVWQSNQFAFENGSGRKASALYRWACIMNHSCSPTVSLLASWSDNTPDLMTDDSHGRIATRALHDLQPGDELCHNFGPPELLDWQLEQRQDFLSKVHGFKCLCLRCVAELSSKHELKITAGKGVYMLDTMD